MTRRIQGDSVRHNNTHTHTHSGIIKGIIRQRLVWKASSWAESTESRSMIHCQKQLLSFMSAGFSISFLWCCCSTSSLIIKNKNVSILWEFLTLSLIFTNWVLSGFSCLKSTQRHFTLVFLLLHCPLQEKQSWNTEYTLFFFTLSHTHAHAQIPSCCCSLQHQM